MILVKLCSRLPAARWAKIAAAVLGLPLLHVVLGSLLFMIFASRYTGVIYWAA